jgi:tetratricopeptide (TPR) repeat protein
MKRILLCLSVFSGFYIACSCWSHASEPIPRSLTGCVIEGIFFSVRGDASVRKANKIITNLDMASYEGKKIVLRGMLSPGDRLQLNSKEVEILGDCSPEWRSAIDEGLAWHYESEAKSAAQKGDRRSAWNFIDRAIQLRSDHCSFYFTRAGLFERDGKIDLAIRDAEQAVHMGGDHCQTYPQLEYLADLLLKARILPEALKAYHQALEACGYPPDREKIREKIGKLETAGRK